MRTTTSPVLTWRDVPTQRLGTVRCLVAEVPDAAPAAGPPWWIWVLHGREGSAEELRPVVAAIAAAAGTGAVPACTVVAPDGPWSHRMSWWTDSAYDGDASGAPAGAAVETGLLQEVLPILESGLGGEGRPRAAAAGAPPAARPAVPPVARRLVVGISMGGSAALRWLLRPDRLFDAAVLLSPAVYRLTPPHVSSARTSGAFGIGTTLFDSSRFAAVAGWEALLRARRPGPRRLRVVTLVGDGELAQDGPGGSAGPAGAVAGGAGVSVPYDLDLQAAQLHAALRREPDVDSHLRVVGGGHDVALWQASVVAALRLALAGTGGSRAG